MKKNLLYLFFCCLLIPLQSRSQSANLISYGTEHGLPQSSIYSMVQDSIGNLWLGRQRSCHQSRGQEARSSTSCALDFPAGS